MANNQISELKYYSQLPLAKEIIKVILPVFCLLIVLVLDQIFFHLYKNIPPLLIEILLLSLLLLFLLRGSFLRHLHKLLSTKLIIKFTVKWDISLNPYCPICNTPLEQSLINNKYESKNLKCPKDGKLFGLQNDDGNFMELKTAKELIKKEIKL